MLRKIVRFVPLTCLLVALIGVPFFSSGQTSQTFFYVATAVDSTGNESVNSNEVSATPTAAHPHVVLTWAASTSTVAGYNIYRATTSGGPYKKINTAIVTTLTLTDTAAFPNPPTGLTAVSN